MMSRSTTDKLYAMRLSTMARTYRDLQEVPGFEEMDFDERFAMIVDAEWDARRTNKQMRLLRQADFCDPDANILDIRYDLDRSLDKAKITELANGEWIREKTNLILTGASGSGKTWLGCALGVAACNAFYSVRYVRLPEMLDELTISKDTDWLKAKKRYLKCDLLILDDWLLESVSDREARELLEIIEGRMRTSELLRSSA